MIFSSWGANSPTCCYQLILLHGILCSCAGHLMKKKYIIGFIIIGVEGVVGWRLLYESFMSWTIEISHLGNWTCDSPVLICVFVSQLGVCMPYVMDLFLIIVWCTCDIPDHHVVYMVDLYVMLFPPVPPGRLQSYTATLGKQRRVSGLLPTERKIFKGSHVSVEGSSLASSLSFSKKSPWSQVHPDFVALFVSGHLHITSLASSVMDGLTGFVLFMFCSAILLFLTGGYPSMFGALGCPGIREHGSGLPGLICEKCPLKELSPD